MAHGVTQHDSSRPMTDRMPVIAADDVSVTIDTTVALATTSLTIAAGEVVAVTGPSGSGKSTLLSCLSGIRVPTRGSVVVAGQELSRMPAASRARFRREHCGVIFQNADLLDELDVVSNVALPLIFSGAPRASALRQASRVLDMVGCGALGGRRPAQLSGGEAQRVAVARAFAGSPAVVIADEPTASLDIDSAAAVTDLIIARARSAGAATVIATHDHAVSQACGREIALHRHAVRPPDGAASAR